MARPLGYKLSEETKKKIGDGNRGKKRSIETIQKLKDSHLGNVGYWKGKPRKEITKKKISEKLKGQKHTKESIKNSVLARIKYYREYGHPTKGISSWSKGKKLPERCGAVHHNWKGGVSSENEKARKSALIKEWRKSVFKRDNYICRCCDKQGGYLEAHHLLSFALYPKYRTVISNGITLCKKCHIKIHKNLPRRRAKCRTNTGGIK